MAAGVWSITKAWCTKAAKPISKHLFSLDINSMNLYMFGLLTD